MDQIFNKQSVISKLGQGLYPPWLLHQIFQRIFRMTKKLFWLSGANFESALTTPQMASALITYQVRRNGSWDDWTFSLLKDQFPLLVMIYIPCTRHLPTLHYRFKSTKYTWTQLSRRTMCGPKARTYMMLYCHVPNRKPLRVNLTVKHF